MLQASLYEALGKLESQGHVRLYCPSQVQSIDFGDRSSPAGPVVVNLNREG
jgi:hypothetical protein